MHKKRYRFLLLFLWVNQTHAVDLNNTTEIIHQATEKTQKIESEINSIIELNQTVAVNETIPLAEPITIDLATSHKEQNQTVEENENTSSIEPLIIESTINSTEVNQTIIEEIIPEEETSIVEIVEESETIQIENNQSIESPKTLIEESNVTKENNTTLNKETFDMSKGEAERGKEIYITHIKETCEMKVSKFAGEYEQEEWEALSEDGKFETTLFKICPKIKESYDNNWSSDLYQFYYENASDSEHIPEC